VASVDVPPTIALTSTRRSMPVPPGASCQFGAPASSAPGRVDSSGM
jgi:hypothetical protein